MFNLTARQKQKLDHWRLGQNKIIIESEQQSIQENDSDYRKFKERWDIGLPFLKTNNETFTFTPGLITVLVVTNNFTGASIDLTEDEEL